MTLPLLPPHRSVHVDLGPRAYDVVIGKGLLGKLGEFMSHYGATGPYELITDGTINGHFVAHDVSKVTQTKVTYTLVYQGIDLDKNLIVPAGEGSKNLQQVGVLLSGLAQRKLPRTGTVIALGGGVIGDLAGFTAASYLRGVAFVQVPTTLLAMVDSSVGGKTGVNLPEGKNLVGAFHQPKLVVADLATLASLPANEFAAGMAEVIKYGAIADRALFERVARGVNPDDADLAQIIETCIAIKARIVEQDEFEEKGLRALLNFGHTLGHAIEKATGYRRYLHGEAISLGMRAAAWLSHWEAGLPLEEVHALEQALLANRLPTHLDEPDDSNALLLVASILAALGNDKKVGGDGRNRWVLVSPLGTSKAGYQIESDVVETALNVLLAPVGAV